MVDGANFLPLFEIRDIDNITEIELAGLHTDKGAKYTVNNHVYRVRINIDFTISFKSITWLNAILKFFCDFKEIEGKNLKQTDVLSLFTVVILNNSTTEQTRTKYLFSGSISNDIKARVLYKLTDEQLFNCIDEFIDTFHRCELPPSPCDRYVPKESEVGKKLHDFIESLKLLPETRLNTFVKLMAKKLNKQEPKAYIIGVDTFFLMIMSELSIEQNIIFNEEISFSSFFTCFVLFYSDKTIEELETYKQIILLLAFSSTKKIFELIDAIEKCNDNFQLIPYFMAQGLKFKLLMVRAKLEAGVTPPLLNELSEYFKGLSAGRAYSSTCSESIFENKDESRMAIDGIITYFYSNFDESHTKVSDMMEVSLQHPDLEPFASFFSPCHIKLMFCFAEESWIICSKRISEECQLMVGDFDENKLTARKLASKGLLFDYLSYIFESKHLNKVLCFECAFSTLTCQQIKDLCNQKKEFVVEKIIPSIINSSAQVDGKYSAVMVLLLKCPTLYIECLFVLPKEISIDLTSILLFNGNDNERLKKIICPSENYSIVLQVELVLNSLFSLSIKRNFITLYLKSSRDEDPLLSLSIQLSSEDSETLSQVLFLKKSLR